MNHSPPHALEAFWTLALEGDVREASDLVLAGGTWDDPLFDGASGVAVQQTAIPRLARWFRDRSTGDARAVQHFRTTANERRVVVESVLALKDGVVWNQIEHRSEKAARFELATALVADRVPHDPTHYSGIRVYFSTWAVLDGASRLRVGPIAPDERADARTAMVAMPTVQRYFDCLSRGDPAILESFEPDGYFREPANNYACGRDQLTEHFVGILKLGGVGIEFLTATRQDERIGFELQTIVWGTKVMDAPQAGFAAYELGPHGLIQGSRVYDSVVPPAFT